MILDVDDDTGAVRLLEPEVLSRFHARSGGDASRVVEALGARAYPSDKPDHLFVRIDALRELARGQVDDAWEAGFQKMIAYAASKGWVDPAGTHVEAHLEPS